MRRGNGSVYAKLFAKSPRRSTRSTNHPQDNNDDTTGGHKSTTPANGQSGYAGDWEDEEELEAEVEGRLREILDRHRRGEHHDDPPSATNDWSNPPTSNGNHVHKLWTLDGTDVRQEGVDDDEDDDDEADEAYDPVADRTDDDEGDEDDEDTEDSDLADETPSIQSLLLPSGILSALRRRRRISTRRSVHWASEAVVDGPPLSGQGDTGGAGDEDGEQGEWTEEDRAFWTDPEDKQRWIRAYEDANRAHIATYGCRIDSGALPEAKRRLWRERRREGKLTLVLVALALVYGWRLAVGPLSPRPSVLPPPPSRTEAAATTIFDGGSSSWWTRWPQELIVSVYEWQQTRIPMPRVVDPRGRSPSSTPDAKATTEDDASSRSMAELSTSAASELANSDSMAQEAVAESVASAVDENTDAGASDGVVPPLEPESTSRSPPVTDTAKASKPSGLPRERAATEHDHVKTAERPVASQPTGAPSDHHDAAHAPPHESTGHGAVHSSRAPPPEATTAPTAQEPTGAMDRGHDEHSVPPTRPSNVESDAGTAIAEHESPITVQSPSKRNEESSQRAESSHASHDAEALAGDDETHSPFGEGETLNRDDNALCLELFHKLVRSKNDASVQDAAIMACTTAVERSHPHTWSLVESLVLRGDMWSFLLHSERAAADYDEALSTAAPLPGGQSLEHQIRMKALSNRWIALYRAKDHKALREECQQAFDHPQDPASDSSTISEDYAGNKRDLAHVWLRAFKREVKLLDALTKARSWTMSRLVYDGAQVD